MYCGNLCWTMFPGWLSKSVEQCHHRQPVLQWFFLKGPFNRDWLSITGPWRNSHRPASVEGLQRRLNHTKNALQSHTIVYPYNSSCLFTVYMHAHMDSCLFYLHIFTCVCVICVRLGKKLMCCHQDVLVAACVQLYFFSLGAMSMCWGAKWGTDGHQPICSAVERHNRNVLQSMCVRAHILRSFGYWHYAACRVRLCIMHRRNKASSHRLSRVTWHQMLIDVPQECCGSG